MNKKKHSILHELKSEWQALDLACKAVSIIGIVLFIHLICTIFIPSLTTQSTINAIFQTSLSSIFGYILGMNIQSKPSTATKANNTNSSIAASITTTNQETLTQPSKAKQPIQYLNNSVSTSNTPSSLPNSNDGTESPVVDNKQLLEANTNDSKSTSDCNQQQTTLSDDTDSTTLSDCLNLRVLFAFGICIASLITLMCYTLIETTTYSDGIVQIGHLVSTTIGFLVSNSTHQH